MSSIDERIVEMEFRNSQFERGIAETIQSLKSLQSSLKLDDAGNGLKGLSKEAANVNLAHIGDDVEHISSRFSAMGAIGFTILNDLTSMALNKGKQIANMIWQPLVEGGKKRALNLAHSRFQFEGLGMDVATTMEAINYAVDGTAYGLDEAAVVAAQFGASGVEGLNNMKAALRGVSGVAAMGGASFDRVGNIFTKVAGQGRLMGDDLNRIGTLGISAASELAKSMGTTEAAVRKMVTDGEIDFQTFANAMDKAFGPHSTKANETYVGSLSNLKSAIGRIGALHFDGLYDAKGAQIFEGHLTRQRDLFNAIRPVVNNVQKALRPLFKVWSEFARVRTDRLVAFFGGLEGRTGEMTPFSRALNHMAEALRNVLEIGETLFGIFSSSFSRAFGSGNHRLIEQLALGIRNFTESMKPSPRTVEILTKVLTVLFETLKFGWETLKVFGEIVWEALMVLSPLGSVIGGVFGEIATAFRDLSESSGEAMSIREFFDMLAEFRDKYADKIIEWLQEAREKFENFLDDADVQAKVKKIIDWISQLNFSLEAFTNPIDTYGETFKNFWENVKIFFETVWITLEPILGKIGEFLTTATDAIGEFLGSITQDDLIAGANFAAIIGAFVLLFKEVQKFTGLFVSAQGVMGSISGAFDELGKLFKRFGQTKTDSFLKIATGMALIGAALIGLAMVDSAKLVGAVLALSIATGLMLIILKMVESVDDDAMPKMATIATALIAFSVSMLIAAGAMMMLASLEWDELKNGLIGFGAAVGALVLSMVILTNLTGDSLKIAGTVIVLALAIAAMAGAILLFAKIDEKAMAKGLEAISKALLLFVTSAAVLSRLATEATQGSAGVLMLATALTAVAGAIYLFAKMDENVLTRGLWIIAGILLGFTVFSIAMSEFASKGAAGTTALLAMAGALLMIVPAIAILGNMEIETLAKGVLAVAAIMGVLALTMAYLDGTGGFKGAASLILMSIAVIGIAAALRILAEVPLGALFGVVGAIALLLGVIVGVGAIAGIPMVGTGLMILAGAMVAIGVAAALMGAGMVAFAFGLALLAPGAYLASQGFKLLGETAKELEGSYGALMKLAGVMALLGIGALLAGAGFLVMGVGILVLAAGLALITTIGMLGANTLVRVMEKIAGISEIAWQLVGVGAAFAVLGAGLLIVGAALVLAGVGALLFGVGIIAIAAGLMMLNNIAGSNKLIPFLTDLINLIPVILAAVAQGLIEVVRIIDANQDIIIAAAMGLIGKFLDGMIEMIPKFVELGVELLLSLIEGITEIIPNLVELAALIIFELVTGLLNLVGDLVIAGIEILTKFLEGVEEKLPAVIEAGTDVIVTLIEGLAKAHAKIVTAAGDAMLKFLTEIGDWLSRNSRRFADEGKRIVGYIADGIGYGIASINLWEMGKKFIGGFIDGMRAGADAHSPSREAIRLMYDISDGIGVGEKKTRSSVFNSGEQVGEGVIDGIRSTLAAINIDEMDMEPTIRPVLDLSDVRREASLLDGILTPGDLSPTRSYSVGATIDTEQQEIASARNEAAYTTRDADQTIYNLTQNNSSPKALSREEIYRQTKNLMSSVTNSKPVPVP